MQLTFPAMDRTPELPLPPGIVAPRRSTVDRWSEWRDGLDNTISETVTVLRGAGVAVGPAAFAGRWRRMLLRRFPGQGRTKAIARAFDCEIGTVKGWLRHPPQAAQGWRVAQAVALLGDGVLDDLYPEARSQSGDARLMLDRLVDDVVALRRKIAEGGTACDS